jgi:hypothetical protein
MGALVALLLLAGWTANASAFTITQIGTSGGAPGGQPVYEVSGLVEGDSFTMTWFYDPPGDDLAIGGTVTITVFDINLTSLVLDITVENTSADSGARIAILGLATDPDATGGSIADLGGGGDVDELTTFDLTSTPPGFPGFSLVEVCAIAGPNCAGGGSDGVEAGDTDEFRLTLTRAVNWPTDGLTLSQFAGKFQGATAGSFELPGSGGSGGSGGGGGSTQIPAPAPLLLLGSALAGLASAGAAWRRFRQ